jgi:hypothetical protein
MEFTEDQLALEGEHPEFGAVTLRQLLATWVAHDLAHLGQISRVMAKQYREAVGPWPRYLGVMEEVRARHVLRVLPGADDSVAALAGAATARTSK